jgi:NADH:ubiquinone oxidoreductase subunit 4 (subunit M)
MSMVGTFCADGLLYYIFGIIFNTYLLYKIWGNGDAEAKAVVKFFIYTLAGFPCLCSYTSTSRRFLENLQTKLSAQNNYGCSILLSLCY